MAKEKELEIVYSTRFQLIGSVKLKGWCVHMVCLQGEGFFTYDGLEKPRDFDPFGQTGFAHLWLQYD